MAGVASEFGRAMFLGDVEPEVVRGLLARTLPGGAGSGLLLGHGDVEAGAVDGKVLGAKGILCEIVGRSEEHTSELQSLMRISYAVFCLKKKNTINDHNKLTTNTP